MIAGLPMYDLPGLEVHTDRLWSAIAHRLRAAGIAAPGQLTRDLPLAALWTDPDLLLAQTCGYPLMKHLGDRVQVVATPVYTAAGCEGPHHRSFIVARHDDRRDTLMAFRDARCALNDESSNTGMNLLRAEIAPFARSVNEPFFCAVIPTGSHTRSIETIIEGEADIAAIDCVTFALLQRLRPMERARLRVIATTPKTLGLPWITACSFAPERVEVLRQSLAAVAADPALKPTLDALLIEGFASVQAAEYQSILQTEKRALELGYPRLQ